jgi:hypothetical protein
MSILTRLFGKTKVQPVKSENAPSEHAVIVKFHYNSDDLQSLYQLEDELTLIISEAGVGILDGHEIAMDLSGGILYMYGPNAEQLFKAIRSTLERADFMKAAVITLRFGAANENAKEIQITL